ncbi:zinc ABC transporter ATP-binding protein AztA [Gordonia humi]|uniref:Zinc/manganese transport system ATP-binding protein n=2 Tax=Gordonia humi TaxID=686429 RepID=A0A840EXR9_9ACTN|nr:zinc ABC transporter ATP-binding protein AztA [Gordonia humi]MBB4135083.1 zinc/manganese transport system ATP-binding protein [Gordonia humi]
MIVVNRLDVTYGSVHALERIDAAFSPGTVSALVGHNGSGKSTLLHVLAGLVSCTHGSVTGVPRSIAFVPQQVAVDELVPLSVAATVNMGLWAKLGAWRRPSRADRRFCMSTMRRMGVLELAERRLGDLSGGQRQRTLLAQALVQQADLLLLDEPTTGLDPDACDIINTAIREEAARGATVIMATHDRRQAEAADTIHRLVNGLLHDQG